MRTLVRLISVSLPGAFLVTSLLADEIHDLARQGDLAGVRARIEQNPALLESKDDMGMTPLFRAVNAGHSVVTRYLIEAGANVNTVRGNSTTPLHGACLRNDWEITAMLLDAGADINATDSDGQTPLGFAVRQGWDGLVGFLIERGCDVNLPGNTGVTPFMTAVDNCYAHIARRLLTGGALIDAVDDIYGRSALHRATIDGYIDMVSLLLWHGADINLADNRGFTPLQFACRHGHKSIADLLKFKGAATGDFEENFGFSGHLAKPLKDGEAVLWYLGNCGWAIKTRNNLLIFDYRGRGWDPVEPVLANGRVNPGELAGQNITLLVTHDHEDHFSPKILDLSRDMSNVKYVFGFQPDEYRGPAYEYVGPHESRKIGDIDVVTIASNDAGVGFLVSVDGLNIYHAGDHAGWREGEREGFTSEIDFIARHVSDVDFAFVNVTGCHVRDTVVLLESAVYTVRKLSPRVLVPTHGAKTEYVYRRVAEKPEIRNLGIKVLCAESRGDRFSYVRE